MRTRGRSHQPGGPNVNTPDLGRIEANMDVVAKLNDDPDYDPPFVLGLAEARWLVGVARAAEWYVGNSVITGDDVMHHLADYQALGAALTSPEARTALSHPRGAE